MTCGHKWYATHLLAPGAPREVIVPGAKIPVRGDYILTEQRCSLPLGHPGSHRSLTNVTTSGSVSPGVTR